MNLVQHLRRTARLFGRQPAVFCNDYSATWAEFDKRTWQLATALRGLGIEPGQRVALLLRNCHRMLEFYYALPRLGAVVVPVNPRLSPPEIQHILEDAEVVALAVDSFSTLYLWQLAPDKAGIKQIIYCGDNPAETPAGTLYYEDLLAQVTETLPDYEPGSEELAGIYYTGGTTGRPKGVMLTHRNINLSALQTVIGFEYTSTDRHLHSAPMFHSADCSQAWGITLVGGSHVFLPAFEPGAVLRAISRYQVTTSLVVPTMLLVLLNYDTFAQSDLSSLRRLAYGAAPIDTALLKRAMAAFPCPLWQGLGTAETSPLLCVLRPEEHTEARLTSCGRPVPGVEIRIVDDEGNEKAPGEVGEIAARGNVMAGYWKQPEETARAIRNGFYHSGDLAYMDEEGFVYIVDRKKDMVISGGENIYTIEVERALLSHPSVQEAAVFGIPDEKWGEAVHAVVVLRTVQPSTLLVPAELIAYVKTRLAPYKAPHSLEIAMGLPKSGAGKILKGELRSKYWVGRERQV
jgi:long-chain acyl-CoA synthetase